MNCKKIILPLMAIVLLASCGSHKDLHYFRNAQTVDLSGSQMLYDARIMP